MKFIKKYLPIIINSIILFAILIIAWYNNYLKDISFYTILVLAIGASVYNASYFFTRAIDKTVTLLGIYYKKKIQDEIKTVVKRIMEG